MCARCPKVGHPLNYLCLAFPRSMTQITPIFRRYSSRARISSMHGNIALREHNCFGCGSGVMDATHQFVCLADKAMVRFPVWYSFSHGPPAPPGYTPRVPISRAVCCGRFHSVNIGAHFATIFREYSGRPKSSIRSRWECTSRSV